MGRAFKEHQKSIKRASKEHQKSIKRAINCRKLPGVSDIAISHSPSDILFKFVFFTHKNNSVRNLYNHTGTKIYRGVCFKRFRSGHIFPFCFLFWLEIYKAKGNTFDKKRNKKNFQQQALNYGHMTMDTRWVVISIGKLRFFRFVRFQFSYNPFNSP